MPDAFGNPLRGERQARRRRAWLRTVVALVGAAPVTFGVLHWTSLDGARAALARFVVSFLVLGLLLSLDGQAWAAIISWGSIFS